MTEKEQLGIVADNFYMMRVMLDNTKDILRSLSKNNKDEKRLWHGFFDAYVSIAAWQNEVNEMFNSETERMMDDED